MQVIDAYYCMIVSNCTMWFGRGRARWGWCEQEHQRFSSTNHQTNDPPNLSNQRNIKPTNPRTNNPSIHRAKEPWNHRSLDPLDQGSIDPSSHRTNNSLKIQSIWQPNTCIEAMASLLGRCVVIITVINITNWCHCCLLHWSRDQSPRSVCTTGHSKHYRLMSLVTWYTCMVHLPLNTRINSTNYSVQVFCFLLVNCCNTEFHFQSHRQNQALHHQRLLSNQNRKSTGLINNKHK